MKRSMTATITSDKAVTIGKESLAKNPKEAPQPKKDKDK